MALEPLKELPLSSAAGIDFSRKASPMAYFEWRPEIEVGHPLIDEQHRKLLSLGEAVVKPLLDTTEHQPGAAQLRALIDFAQEHFAFEESEMRSTGYPESDLHAKYHASLLTELKAYCVKVQQGQHTNPAGLISFLWNWLVLHIDSADRQLVVWMKARETGNGA
jgi:hemerythrin